MTASVITAATGSVRRTTEKPGRRGQRPWTVIPASAGDHPSIHHFLTAVFQAPAPGEYRASLEDPFYRPGDRMLIKRGPRIVAHVHMARRVVRFGPLEVPAAWFDWLGTLPECRRQGCGRRLLAAAEEHAASEGALLGLTWTRIPHYFRESGWAACGRRESGRLGARAVLSGLIDRGLLRRGRKHLNIRPFRRVELPALMRIYNQSFSGMVGPLERTQSYWEWLMGRHAYDQICVALDGPDTLELEEARAPIVGYAVNRGERIVELLTAPGHHAAVAQLLARACHDVIERGRHFVHLDAPADSRVDKLFRGAGGKNHCHIVDQSAVLMVKLLDPIGLLGALACQLPQRAEAAGLARPVELGLLVEGKKYRLAVTRADAYAAAGTIGRSYLRMNVADFTRLVLGRLDWDPALADGRVKASTNVATAAGRGLLPQLPFWCPPLDHLTARK
ncbi:MAG: GNAT family N-acetyltransferase [Planctomycetota bacterium]|jgi:ribosomal protein S18 acetylase RimI-like enzyme